MEQKPSPRIADNAKRTTIIAAVSAVVAALLIFTVGGCVYRKKRQRDDGKWLHIVYMWCSWYRRNADISSLLIVELFLFYFNSDVSNYDPLEASVVQW